MNLWSRLFCCLAFAVIVLMLPSCPKSAPIQLVVKAPVISMHAENDPELRDVSNFLERAAKAFAAQYKEEVNVSVVCFRQTEEDAAVRECFDTPFAPDVLFEGYFNMSGYIHTGRVVPLDDIITDALRKDVPEPFWRVSQAVNGKTYMMPFLSLQNTLGCNADLVCKYGPPHILDDGKVIHSWTAEEWDNILATLHKNLPQDTFVYFMYAKNSQGDTHVMTLLRMLGCPLFDSKGRFCVNTPEGIAALRRIAEWNRKGYYPTLAEHLEIADCSKLFTNGQMAFSLANIALIYPGINVELVNFPSATPNGYATSFIVGFEVFDNGDPKKLQTAKDFVSFKTFPKCLSLYCGYCGKCHLKWHLP